MRKANVPLRRHISLMQALAPAAAFVAALAFSTTAKPTYIHDDAHGLVRFTVKLAGLSDVEGRFAETDAAITYDDSDLTKSTVTALIHVASIDTDVKERDEHLCSADFFDAAKFPAIRFQSKRIEKRGDGWVAIGDLTLHGITHEIALPFEWAQKKAVDPFGNDRISFESHFKLKRSDYGMPGPEFWGRLISDEVEILLRISARIYNWDNINGSASKGKSFIPELLPLFEKDDPAALPRLEAIQAATGDEYNRGEWQYHVLGRKLYRHGKINASLQVFTKYAEVYPQSPQALDDLADAYEALGDVKQAAVLLEKSIKLDPFDANAIENRRHITP
jgi:polyisoprenoid-binding protein YceI